MKCEILKKALSIVPDDATIEVGIGKYESEAIDVLKSPLTDRCIIVNQSYIDDCIDKMDDNSKILIDKELLEEIMHILTFLTGLNATDKVIPTDEKEIILSVDELINIDCNKYIESISEVIDK